MQAALDLRPTDVPTGAELLPFERSRSCAPPALRLLLHRWGLRLSSGLFLFVLLSKLVRLLV